jgi:serine-aspartate repeat-containing protein C/D/E
MDGIATFTKVPQAVVLRVKVTRPPQGAIPTKMNVGDAANKDSDTDSDLGANGISSSFLITGDGAPFSKIDLGYRMPSSVVVFVWDDKNGNGVQDVGEPGIQGVKLVLVQELGLVQLTEQNNGGNCHEERTSDENGFVSFTQVPQGIKLKVKVTNAPQGSLATLKDQGGNKDTDSDFSNGLSDTFVMLPDGDMTEIDLGYKLPSDVKVRVWDDINGTHAIPKNPVLPLFADI